MGLYYFEFEFELVDELSKELLVGALEAADAAHVWSLSSAGPL